MNINSKTIYNLEMSSAEFYSVLQALKIAKNDYIDGCIAKKETEELFEKMNKVWEGRK